MTTTSDLPARTSTASPEALLKAAVSGGEAAKAAVPLAIKSRPLVAKPRRRIDPLTVSLGIAGLALGAMMGAGTAIMAAPRFDGAALAEVKASLEANRVEASRLGIASDRLDRSIAALREVTDSGRNEADIRNATLIDKVGTAVTTLIAKVGVLTDRIEQMGQEQGGRIAALAAQTEKRFATAAPTSPAKFEPIQTGSIPEPKPKPTVVESWSVRDVYNDTAMLEDRRRRLLEVSVGDTIPGIGRVEAVERRGRDWVVVTRQGIVTAQPW